MYPEGLAVHIPRGIRSWNLARLQTVVGLAQQRVARYRFHTADTSVLSGAISCSGIRSFKGDRNRGG